jgi:hypothetical protein
VRLLDVYLAAQGLAAKAPNSIAVVSLKAHFAAPRGAT